MNLHFNTIAEPGLPGPKWQKLFNTHWDAYRKWLDSKGASYVPDLKMSQTALKKYMPEMWPTYERLCKLAIADEVAGPFSNRFPATGLYKCLLTSCSTGKWNQAGSKL